MSEPKKPAGAPGSALEAALALLAAGTQRGGHNPAWNEAAWEMSRHCEGLEDVSEAAMRVIAESRDWYRRRVELLSREQRRMRDPERTLVCDIIANGQLLPDHDGYRYGAPNA